MDAFVILRRMVAPFIADNMVVLIPDTSFSWIFWQHSTSRITPKV